MPDPIPQPGSLSEERLEDWAARQDCGCGQRGPRVEWRLETKPLFSPSGLRRAGVVKSWPWLVCEACGDEFRVSLTLPLGSDPVTGLIMLVVGIVVWLPHWPALVDALSDANREEQ